MAVITTKGNRLNCTKLISKQKDNINAAAEADVMHEQATTDGLCLMANGNENRFVVGLSTVQQ